MGAPVSLEAEDNYTVALQAGATADGNGVVANVGGYSGPLTAEIVNSGTAASTITFEASIDGTRWYATGYQQIDAVANPVRTTGGITMAASTQHIYALLDSYNFIRARMSGTQAGANITVNLSCNPL
jgi:hypothetical protein